jgi:flagellar biosynthesis/type III secretory pathway protein FliH
VEAVNEPRRPRRSVGIEFQAKPERVVELVRQVMKPAKLYTRVKVLLHPDDVDRVKADQARLG